MNKLFRYLIIFIVNALAVFITGWLLSGVNIDGFVGLLITTVVIGIINTFIKPILALLTLPITFLTLGLFYVVLNALMIMLADAVLTDFTVSNFWWALLFSVVLAIVSGILGFIFVPKKK